MTTANFWGFWTPFPLVTVPITHPNSTIVTFWPTPLSPLSAEVIWVWPPTINPSPSRTWQFGGDENTQPSNHILSRLVIVNREALAPGHTRPHFEGVQRWTPQPESPEKLRETGTHPKYHLLEWDHFVSVYAYPWLECLKWFYPILFCARGHVRHALTNVGSLASYRRRGPFHPCPGGGDGGDAGRHHGGAIWFCN